MKQHPVTGKDVPDETARVPLWHYVNPRQAEWPEADYIVGNPPFIGNKRMRAVLGDGYAESLRLAYPEVTEVADLVMYWWESAAELVRRNKAKRFGLITTNSITQSFNRRVIQTHLAAPLPLSVVFAIPDHPWVDATDGAAVRVAMTVGIAGGHSGEILKVQLEEGASDGSVNVSFRRETGHISSNLNAGSLVVNFVPLQSNIGMALRGMTLVGKGFLLNETETAALRLGAG
jgi:hypothetical protein